MKYRVTIAGKPVIGIYECKKNARCWFITNKVQKHGQYFLSGYVRCFNPEMLAEFHHLPEEVLDDTGNSMRKVPEDAWWRCPCVNIEEDRGQRKIVYFKGRDSDARPLRSCSNRCKGVNEKMDADTKKRLVNYIELFDEISEKTEDANIAVAILHEMSKDRRAEQMRSERETKKSSTVTFKQKKCMERLGIDFPDDISRKEASVLIQEELDRLNGVGE